MAREESLKPFRISEIIRAEIAELLPHTVLPTERQMAERFGVSRVSVQKALEILMEGGEIYRRQGAGTFVAPPRTTSQMQVRSFSEEIEMRGMIASTKVLDVSIVKAGTLELISEPAYRIERLRLGNSEPISWEVSYVACDVAPGIESLDLTGSLYTVLEREYQQEVLSIDEQISPLVATKDIARTLNIPVGGALFQVDRNGFNSRGEPIEVSQSIRRGDKWDLRYSIHK